GPSTPDLFGGGHRFRLISMLIKEAKPGVGCFLLLPPIENQRSQESAVIYRHLLAISLTILCGFRCAGGFYPCPPRCLRGPLPRAVYPPFSNQIRATPYPGKAFHIVKK